MTFTQDLDPGRSSIVVVTGGTEIASGGEVDPSEPRRMTLALPALEPGAYEIRWTTLERGGRRGPERGITTFTFTPPPPTPSPTPTLAPARRPRRRPAPTPADGLPRPVAVATRADGPSTTDILLPIIVAVLVIAGFGTGCSGDARGRRNAVTHRPVARAGIAALVGSALAAVALAAPAAVAAHSLNVTYQSRLPLAVYVAGAALTVALSFAFVMLADVRAEPAAATGPGRLPPAWLRYGLRAIGLIGWTWIVVQGILGGQSAGDVKTLFLWVYGWVGIAIVSARARPGLALARPVLDAPRHRRRAARALGSPAGSRPSTRRGSAGGRRRSGWCSSSGSSWSARPTGRGCCSSSSSATPRSRWR